jgi:hypothetical protein
MKVENINDLIGPINRINTPTDRFDGRSYWTRNAYIAGQNITVEWVAEGEHMKNWEQFFDHSTSIFTKLFAYCRCRE